MRFEQILVLVLVGAGCLTQPLAAAPYQTSDEAVDLDICMVHLIRNIEIPARETGLLKERLVEQNDEVRQSQVIARIDDQVAQRSAELARFKETIARRTVEDDSKIQMAEKKMSLTSEEYKTNFNLYRKGSKTKFEAQRSLFQQEISALEHTAAIKEREMAEIQAQSEAVNVKAAEELIQRHVIESPLDGFVLQVYKEAGEWVNAGETIVRVGPLSRLRVHGTLDALQYDPGEVEGKPVTVTLTRARGRTVQFPGVVVLASLENQGGTSYQVIAEVENRRDPSGNRFLLLPGSTVQMRIHLNGGSPAGAADPGFSEVTGGVGRE